MQGGPWRRGACRTRLASGPAPRRIRQPAAPIRSPGACLLVATALASNTYG
jgi:hypothetical protein